MRHHLMFHPWCEDIERNEIQCPTLRIMNWVLCQCESFLCYCLQNPTKEISPEDERDARAMPETSTSIWYKNTIHLLNITEQRSSSNTNSIIQYKGVRRFSTCIMLRVSSCCHLATGVIQLGYITLTALKVNLRTSGVHILLMAKKPSTYKFIL